MNAGILNPGLGESFDVFWVLTHCTLPISDHWLRLSQWRVSKLLYIKKDAMSPSYIHCSHHENRSSNGYLIPSCTCAITSQCKDYGDVNTMQFYLLCTTYMAGKYKRNCYTYTATTCTHHNNYCFDPMIFSPEGLVNSQPIDNLTSESWKGLWTESHGYGGAAYLGELW